jgi:STE24 endopeptidase
VTISAAVLLLGLAAGLGFRLWLGLRNITHLRGCDPDAKATGQTVARERLLCLAAVLSGLLVLVLSVGGGIAAIDGLLPPFFVVLTAAGAFAVVGLSTALWRRLVLDVRFGLAKAGLGSALGAMLRREAPAAALFVGLAFVALWLLEAVGSLWWLVAWALWTAISIGRTLLPSRRAGPSHRLEQGALRSRLEALAARTSTRLADIRVAEVSHQTSRANGSVEGLGGAKRVLLHDTLLAALDEAEVEAVMAHELGHARLRHEEIWLAALSLGRLLGLGLFAWAARTPEIAAGLGLGGGSAGAELALIGVLFVAAGLLVSPLKALLVRHLEQAADAFAAHHADPRALGSALVTLDRVNAAAPNPDPLYAALVQGHPPTGERLRFLSTVALAGMDVVPGEEVGS